MSEVSKETDSAPMQSSVTVSLGTSPNELKRTVKIHELPSVMHHVTQAGISRERSFVRASNPQNHQVRSKIIYYIMHVHSNFHFKNLNKRRSLGFHQHQQHQQQLRMKPALEIYRPPSKQLYLAQILFSWLDFSLLSDIRLDLPQNKLNVHAQEFTMNMQRGLELQRFAYFVRPNSFY